MAWSSFRRWCQTDGQGLPRQAVRGAWLRSGALGSAGQDRVLSAQALWVSPERRRGEEGGDSLGPRPERVGRVSATLSGTSVESRECRTRRPCRDLACSLTGSGNSMV